MNHNARQTDNRGNSNIQQFLGRDERGHEQIRWMDNMKTHVDLAYYFHPSSDVSHLHLQID